MPYPTVVNTVELLSILERLHPDSLLLQRGETGLDEETQQLLWRKVAFSYDPRRRLATIECLLLSMHQACDQDRSGYLAKVFLPWFGLKRRLEPQILRIVDDIARGDEINEHSNDYAAHVANKVYRPLVSDVFDPYMTLLVATYAFIEGTFVDIETSNLGALERSKAEIVESRIRRSGGPADLLDGYDPIVRNALSHTGSDGVLYDPGSVVFRSIKRGSPPVVEARRWTHDELHAHVIALIELVMSVDAAVEIFGLDNVDAMSEGQVRDRFIFHALDSKQRRALSASVSEELVRIRRTETIPLTERFELLGRILFQQCAERNIACGSVGFNYEQKACIVTVPVPATPVSDDEIREQVMLLIRYLVLARSVFGEMFERFMVDGEAGGATVIRISLEAGPLDEYIAENAGLIDLIGDAQIWFEGRPLTLAPDFAAVAAAEDTMIGPRLPRRGRPA